VSVDHKAQAPKAAELVAMHFRQRIARGDLIPGDRLPPEDELMRSFGVARTTLREGLRILESEGFLSVQRGRSGGPRITEPSIDRLAQALALHLQLEHTKVRDLDQARQLIEPWLAARLAERCTRQDLGALEDAIVQAEDAAARDDREAFAIAATAVHETIAERGGNQTLALVARMLHELVAEYYRRAASSSAPADMQRATRSYRKLHKLVAAGDVEGARDHWEKQMTATMSRRDPQERLNVFDAPVDLALSSPTGRPANSDSDGDGS